MSYNEMVALRKTLLTRLLVLIGTFILGVVLLVVLSEQEWFLAYFIPIVLMGWPAIYVLLYAITHPSEGVKGSWYKVTYREKFFGGEEIVKVEKDTSRNMMEAAISFIINVIIYVLIFIASPIFSIIYIIYLIVKIIYLSTKI